MSARASQPWRPKRLQSPSTSPISSTAATMRPLPSPKERPAELLDHVALDARGKYAYVMLVMKGDSYAVGAMTAAHSLKLTRTKHDLVCMVTPDVTQECRRIMSFVFDLVVEVPYLIFKTRPMRTQKQRLMYDSWSDSSFTKWNILSLVQYEKAMFVDADKLVLANIDHLFDLPAPAGTFSSPWSRPFVERRDAARENETASAATPASLTGARRTDGRLKYKYKGMVNPYEACKHGGRVSSSKVMTGLLEESFVVIGTMVLLSPNMKDYEQYKEMVSSMQPFGFADSHSMVDEQSLSYYFAVHKNKQLSAGAGYSEWTFIHQRYNYIPWHRYWLAPGIKETPLVFHFFSVKPWILDRSEFLDLEAWWQIVTLMIANADPSIRTDLQSLFSDKLLNMEPAKGCAWCRVTAEFERSGSLTWKDHNILTIDGKLGCAQLAAGAQ